jgi:hypothetical protein
MTAEELTIQYEEDGVVKVKELDKALLSKGAWTTIMFLYQELDTKTGQMSEPKISIRRYKKSADVYRQQSKFNITNQKQANQIIEIIKKWFEA